jgi:hypothetical protein
MGNPDSKLQSILFYSSRVIYLIHSADGVEVALYEWEVALNQRKSVHEMFYDLHVGVEKKLFQRLKWSYDVLPDYLKICFLYFAAYPEDKVIKV